MMMSCRHFFQNAVCRTRKKRELFLTTWIVWIIILTQICVLTGCAAGTGSESGSVSEKESTREESMEREGEDILQVQALKVGKADAIVLFCGGETMVIDCGEEDVHRVILPAYSGSGAEYEDFMAVLEKAGAEPENVKEPVRFQLGDSSVLVEPPASYEIPDNDKEYDNNFSLITTVDGWSLRETLKNSGSASGWRREIRNPARFSKYRIMVSIIKRWRTYSGRCSLPTRSSATLKRIPRMTGHWSFCGNAERNACRQGTEIFQFCAAVRGLRCSSEGACLPAHMIASSELVCQHACQLRAHLLPSMIASSELVCQHACQLRAHLLPSRMIASSELVCQLPAQSSFATK